MKKLMTAIVISTMVMVGCGKNPCGPSTTEPTAAPTAVPTAAPTAVPTRTISSATDLTTDITFNELSTWMVSNLSYNSAQAMNGWPTPDNIATTFLSLCNAMLFVKEGVCSHYAAVWVIYTQNKQLRSGGVQYINEAGNGHMVCWYEQTDGIIHITNGCTHTVKTFASYDIFLANAATEMPGAVITNAEYEVIKR